MNRISLETAMMILDTGESVAMTDENGRYIYTNKVWRERTQLPEEVIYRSHPWDLFPESKFRPVLETHKPVIGHTFKSPYSNLNVFCNYYPVFKDGKFAGAIVWTIFEGMGIAKEVAEKISSLTRELEKTKETLRRLETAAYSLSNIIGGSRAIRILKDEIMAAARTNSNVLIEGETGVGKELVAHSIHDLSRRHNNRFVRVNCSAIPADLLESEFFGYEEGAFTGARKGGKIGKFELANGGSLFLDEINQLSLNMQPKFLRVLQEHEIERVGGLNVIPIDVRLIAASNVPVEKLVKEDKFRMDLYYRLNVINIRVPPLRERMEDIPLLVRNLVDKLNYQMGLNISHISDEVLDKFMEYDWPGNIRELQNVLENAMNRAYDETLEVKHFEQFFNRVRKNAASTRKNKHSKSLTDTKINAEYDAVLAAMEKCKGNKVAAAKQLGVSRNTLYNKLKQYGML